MVSFLFIEYECGNDGCCQCANLLLLMFSSQGALSARCRCCCSTENELLQGGEGDGGGAILILMYRHTTRNEIVSFEAQENWKRTSSSHTTLLCIVHYACALASRRTS